MNCVVELMKTLFVNHYPKLIVSQLAFWGVSAAIKNPTLVDVAWGANHVILGMSILSSVKAGLTFSNMISIGILSLWFLRLGGFIFYHRIWKPHVDPRYLELAQKRAPTQKNLFYFFQFQFQGVLSVFTSIPLYYLFLNNSFQVYNYAGVALALIGILGEAIADQQLQNYKDNRQEGQSGVFRGGLFKHARHPNLFFELVTWYGIALMAFNHLNLCSALAFAGPTFLYLIMTRLTIPVTLAHMKKSRPDYQKVIAETNKFWPFWGKSTSVNH